MTQIILKNEAATIALATQLATQLQTPFVGFFSGDLGSGKTTFIRALLRTLGITGTIKSPTFSLVEPYQLNQQWLYHLDLYRIENSDEILYLGIRDYYQPNNMIFIEWAEKAAGVLPPPDLHFTFHMLNEGRQLAIEALSPQGQSIIKTLFT